MSFDRKQNGRKTAEVTCRTDQGGIKSPTLKRGKTNKTFVIQPRKYLLTLKVLFILKVGSLVAYF